MAKSEKKICKEEIVSYESGYKIVRLKPRKFSDKIKDKIKSSSKSIKSIIVLASVVGIHISHTSYNFCDPAKSKICMVDENYNKRELGLYDINDIVSARTQSVQEKILSNVDSLQRLIVQARYTGNKQRVVKRILDDVYPNGHLSGNTHYCVAGAAKARLMCDDSILNNIMPVPEDYPNNQGYASSPNVSCVYLRKYFDDTLGENYAQRGDKNFNNIVNNLEAGDILIVKSSRNTSSGEHCVTVAGPMNKNGSIPVMSLNTESNYSVYPRQVIGAAKIIEQYRHDLTNTLLQYYEESLTFDRTQPSLAYDDGSKSKVNEGILLGCLYKGYGM